MTEYRVDELAQAAATSVRNVRVYQDRGLLPPPRRVGRTGIYSDGHLSRLRLIRVLLDRGHTFATIRELLEAHETSQGIEQLLSLDGVISVPWSSEPPDRVTVADLAGMFGEFSPGELERAVELGLVRPEGDGFVVPSVRLLEAGAHLVDSGMALPSVLELAAGLREQMSQVARMIFRSFGEHVAASGQPSTEVADTVLRLRPFAQQAVDALLAMAMNRESEQLLAKRSRRSGQKTLRDPATATE